MDAINGETPHRQRVRVWFGEHPICDYSADTALANRYAATMSRRFSGLRITIDDVLNGTELPVPSERLWELVP
jgi:hypothetical protein